VSKIFGYFNFCKTIFHGYKFGVVYTFTGIFLNEAQNLSFLKMYETYDSVHMRLL
jgi:hypothetical protein